MWRILWLVLMLVLVACDKPSHQERVEPGTGRLVPWSKQVAKSPRKLILLPGCVDTTDPHGLTPVELEDYFDQMIHNFQALGDEVVGEPTFDRVELWLASYYPNQSIDKIASDVALAITNNSHFNNSCTAIVGHSQGGVVVWLLDQRHSVMAGGITLGAPILSTPVALKPVRDTTVQRVFPVAYSRLIPVFDQLAVGTDHLATAYPESNQSQTQLMLVAGQIKSPSANFWQRNMALLDVLANQGDTLLDGARDNRQLAELGALLIDNSKWRDNTKTDRASDGLVPVSSATLNGRVNHRVWSNYDHWELLSGRGDLNLHKAMLEWLVQVWGLKRTWVVTDLPATPDVIELPHEIGAALDWVKFAYVDGVGRLVLTDENWDRSYQLTLSGTCWHPQFDDEGNRLAVTISDGISENVYVLAGAIAQQISFDGQSRFPTWSPNDQWLTYQSAGNLIIHRLASDNREVVANGISLIAPPVWTVDRLSGRIYFVNDSNELRWVSPRGRDRVSTNLVQSDCLKPFLVKGPIGGMIVVGPGSVKDSQRINVVTGWLTDHLSVELRYDQDGWRIEQNGPGIVLTLDQSFNFVEAVYDPTYNHLYLVGELGGRSGIHLLDIQAFLDCAKPDPELNDFFSLIREDATQLTIKPSR